MCFISMLLRLWSEAFPAPEICTAQQQENTETDSKE